MDDVAAATGPDGITRAGPQLEIGFGFRAMHHDRWPPWGFLCRYRCCQKMCAGTGGNKLL